MCHTVQVAGTYEEDEDRADEENSLLNVDAEIPPIFHKSIEDLNEIESVHEEIDFIASRTTVMFERNGRDDKRPQSDVPTQMKPSNESHHKRPLSLSNIQLPKSSTSGPDSPLKHVEFATENMLLRRVQQQEYKRTVSHNVTAAGEQTKLRETMTHRRTQSSIPFGSAGKRPESNQSVNFHNCFFSCNRCTSVDYETSFPAINIRSNIHSRVLRRSSIHTSTSRGAPRINDASTRARNVHRSSGLSGVKP